MLHDGAACRVLSLCSDFVKHLVPDLIKDLNSLVDLLEGPVNFRLELPVRSHDTGLRCMRVTCTGHLQRDERSLKRSHL